MSSGPAAAAARPAPDAEDDRPRVLALLKRFGWNATSFQALEPGFLYRFDGEDACVAYVDTGTAWVAAGAPIAPLARLDEVAQRFVAAARAHGRRVVFFATEERFTARARLEHLLVGEQPYWEPRRWPAAVAASASLREQLRRASAKGVHVRPLRPGEARTEPLRSELRALVARWLGSRPMAPMGFLVELHLVRFEEERRCFVAEHDGRLVGFLNAVPVYARHGLLIEDVLRDPVAPNGTSELLVDSALRAAAEEGIEWVTLGLAPLAGDVAAPLRAARLAGAGLFAFEGLRAYKARLRPQGWMPIHASHPAGASSTLAVLDVLRAFAHGHLLGFGLATLRRGPTVVFRGLALALLPWATFLALVPTDPWFPSRAAQAAWIGFDLVLAALLWRLGRRWSGRLALGLALLSAADAVVTAVEVVAWDRARADGLATALACTAAVAGPALLALLLWSARAHRRAWSRRAPEGALRAGSA